MYDLLGLGMAGNYEQRLVANFTKDGIMVDTTEVYDSSQPYETAVEHPQYNDGSMVIVELYPTKEDAQKGHDKWVKIMTAKKLPKELKDVSTAHIAKLAYDGCDDFQRIKPKQTKS